MEKNNPGIKKKQPVMVYGNPFPVSSGPKRPKRATTRGPLAVPVAVHVSWNKILARAGTATLFRFRGSKRSKRATQMSVQYFRSRAPVAQWLEHRNLQVPRTTGHSRWRMVAGCSLSLAGSPRSIPAVLGSGFLPGQAGTADLFRSPGDRNGQKGSPQEVR